MITRNRILIVDDHAAVRDGIRTFLENKTPFTVCGEADNGTAAIQQAKRLKPDLIVLDLAMPTPGLNGVEAASVLKCELPYVKIVAFSMYADELGKAVASATHIDSVLPKASGLTVLAETIRRLLHTPPRFPSSTGSPQAVPSA